MQLFDLVGARHYCRPLPTAQTTLPPSLSTFHDSLATSVKTFKEGTPEFEERRVVALHDVERLLFLAASNYLRALDLLVASAAPWAHVTLYYSSFFGAQALVGMFGGWIDAPDRIVQVQTNAPLSQELVLKKKVKSPNLYGGSHRMFWDFFYDACTPMINWTTDAAHHFALTPVSSVRTWQIDERNDVNYDARTAYDAVTAFPGKLNATNFRKSLSGSIVTQLEVTEGMLLLAFEFARDFKIDSHALAALNVGKRPDCIKRLVAQAKLPKLASQSKMAAFSR